MRWLAGLFKRKEGKITTFDHTDLEKRHILSLRSKKIPSITQLKYIPEYLTHHERYIIRISVTLILLCAAVFGIRFWQKNIVWVPRAGGVYTEAMIGFPRYINPVLAIGNNTDNDLARIFFPGLVTTNEKNEIITDLAESYEISEDAKKYTFTLKENLHWDDGEPLTINDVMFTFQLIKDSSYASPWGFTFANTAFEQTGDRSMTVTLSDPSTLFINYFTIGILPAHRYADVLPANFLLTEDNTRPTGAGPFKFKSFTRSRSGEIRSITVERNPLYHGKSAYLNEIRFKFYPDVTSAVMAVRDREAQGVAFAPPWLSPEELQVARTKETQLILPQVNALFFNLKNDLFKNKDFRRALILGLDRNKLMQDVLYGGAVISEGPFAPGFAGFVAELNPRPHIPVEAEQLLDSVGYKKGDDGIRKRGDGKLRLVITTVNQDPYPLLAENIKADWAEHGIEVEVQLVEPGRFSQDVLKPRRYDILLYGELFDQTLDPYAFWHSSQALDPGLNFSVYINKKVDTLLQENREEWVREERVKRYEEMQRILADDLPAIFLQTPIYHYIVPTSLRSIANGNLLTSADRFKDVASWYKKTSPALKSSLGQE